jgi:D-galactarolactone cycloisomerase
MRIKEINPIAIELPLQDVIQTSFGKMTTRKHLLVEVITEDGITGYGEVWTNFPEYNTETKLFLYEKVFIPLLTGLEFNHPEEVYREMREKILATGAGKQWGAYGHLKQAMSGIDMAVWDIYAKKQNKPLFKLLRADAQAQPIKAYSSGLGPENVAAKAKKALEAGFRMFKLKVGFSLEKDLNNLKEIRKVIGDLPLFLDANQGFQDEQSAIEHLQQYLPYNFEFIEEPLLANDFFGLKKVRDAGFKIAGGENNYSLLEFQNLHRLNCLDIYQPDIGKCGGVTAMREIVGYLEEHRLNFAPHMFSTIIGQTASLHFLTAYSGLFMEVDANDNPALHALAVKTPFTFREGCFYYNEEKNGIVTLDFNYLNKHRIY